MTNYENILKANKYGMNWTGGEYRTPILQEAMIYGMNGVDLSSCPVVKGYRYGKAPDSGISYNYRDEKSERGLSLAGLENGKEVGSSMFFNDRKIYCYEGILLPKKGSDGEPLILAFNFEMFD